jgi:VIT1/CCC1 family predicted Fe2+/Mn2+ transporter/rubrerythrin
MATERIRPDEPVPGLSQPPAVTTTSRTGRNLWLAFTEEAKAQSLYQAYAIKAIEEGHPEVAEVFMQVAGAETVHAMEHLKALGEVGSTYENLSRVIEEELREASVMYPRMIRQAESEGRTDAAATFQLAFEGESHHAELFEQAFVRLRRKGQIIVPSRPAEPTLPVPRLEPAAAGAPASEAVAEEEGTEKARVARLRRIREVVFGAQDGLTSTVAIAATVMAATGTPAFAILAGAASAMAGTISMAAGTYLGSRAATQMEEAELEMEWRELLRRPDEERAELISTFRHDGYQLEEAETMADRLMDDRQLALRFMAERELGIAAEAPTDPRKDAAVMAGSYVVGGLLPLIPYVLFADLLAIVASIALTILALGAVGVIKARTAHRPVFTSVLEVVGIGAAAGALGYALGEWLPRLFGIG